MILQALNAYYWRKQADSDPRNRLPAYGLEEKEIPFIIEIDAEGGLINVTDTRAGEGKKLVARRFLVPQGVKRASGVAANLLWDTAEYVLGVDTRDKRDRVVTQHAAFRSRIEGLPDPARQDPGVQAVLAFLDRLDLAAFKALPQWNDISTANPLMTFRVHPELELVCQRPAVVATVRPASESTATAACLVTGDRSEVERLHAAIKGVWGAQTSGANIVSFNALAFESYGKRKRQGENAPVGKPAAFAYTTALNHLLDKGSRQRVQIGDTSTVFWAAAPHALETLVPDLFGEPRKDDPNRGTDAVKALYSAIQSGKFAVGGSQDRFHVLGLAPNAARIAIRVWETAPALELAQRIQQHFEDLRIERNPGDTEHLPVKQLLIACAVQAKPENIPPKLAGDLMRAIFAGSCYPRILLVSALQRAIAEQAKKDKNGKHINNVSYARAALLKAWLNRQSRSNQQQEEISVSLDESNDNISYRLGRLFAVLEKIQQDAHPRINTTIRDSFFGAACATPSKVFPTLVRKNQHHMASLRKEKPGLHVVRDKLIGEVLNEGIDGRIGFPKFLTLEDQGRFVIGYYQQRQALFIKH
jgi:CRISPR-associated protein Csd1